MSDQSNDAVDHAYRVIRDLFSTMLTVDQAAERLGLNPRQVNVCLRARRLYGFEYSVGEIRLPAFQFVAEGLLPGIEQVIPIFPKSASVLQIVHWLSLLNPHLLVGDEQIPVTPIAWLASGRDPAAVAKRIPIEFLTV